MAEPATSRAAETAPPKAPPAVLGTVAQLASVVSVVVGVIVSVLSFNAARVKEAEARKFEAAKPFLVLRQNLYTEMVKTAGVLSNPETETPEALAAARKRFRELYVAELSMVEDSSVEQAMINLADQVDPDMRKNWTPSRNAAYKLSHALRDSFVQTYGINDQPAPR